MIHITEVSYSETRQVSEGSWVKVSLKASLDPTDNPDEAYQHLQQKVNQYHSTTPPLPIKSTDKETIVDDEDIYSMMDKCKTGAELNKNFSIIYPKMSVKEKNYYDTLMNKLPSYFTSN